MKKTFTHLEAALLIGLAAALLWSAAGLQLQQNLADKMLRLHVIANSDSEEDQSLKLTVRDRVLETVSALVAETDTLKDARAQVTAHMEEIRAAAQSAVYTQGYSYPVSLSLDSAYFPTKSYDGFALPSGVYDALRVEIGESAGQNWWCVLFPPFCTGAAFEEEAVAAGLSQDEIHFMSSDGAYEIRFRFLDFLSKIQAFFAR